MTATSGCSGCVMRRPSADTCNRFIGARQLCAAYEQQFAALGTCRLASGNMIRDCRIGYRTFGKLNADKPNAILFPMWFSAVQTTPQCMSGRKSFLIRAATSSSPSILCETPSCLRPRTPSRSQAANFPTLLGAGVYGSGPSYASDSATGWRVRATAVERALYQAGCAVNALRNKTGTRTRSSVSFAVSQMTRHGQR